ncbi:hypothetical protein [Georgenia muralis]
MSEDATSSDSTGSSSSLDVPRDARSAGVVVDSEEAEREGCPIASEAALESELGVPLIESTGVVRADGMSCEFLVDDGSQRRLSEAGDPVQLTVGEMLALGVHRFATAEQCQAYMNFYTGTMPEIPGTIVMLTIGSRSYEDTSGMPARFACDGSNLAFAWLPATAAADEAEWFLDAAVQYGRQWGEISPGMEGDLLTFTSAAQETSTATVATVCQSEDDYFYFHAAGTVESDSDGVFTLAAYGGEGEDSPTLLLHNWMNSGTTWSTWEGAVEYNSQHFTFNGVKFTDYNDATGAEAVVVDGTITCDDE